MLAEHTLLLSRADCSYRRIIEDMMRESGCAAGMVFEFNSVASIMACVTAGLGVTLIPEVAVRDAVGSGQLAVLPWAEDELETAQLMIWHRDKWLTPVMKEFMQAVRRVCRADHQCGINRI